MALTTKVRERLEERFRLWDNDGDGRVEREDFEAEAQEILKNFGASASSTKGRRVMETYLGMWDYLAQVGKVGPEGFSPEQFIDVCTEHIIEKGGAGFDQVVRPTISAIVDLCDTDGDGQVNPDEWKLWTKAIGVDPSQADEAFRQIDVNSNGQLSVDELVNAVGAYHAGEIDAPLLGR